GFTYQAHLAAPCVHFLHIPLLLIGWPDHWPNQKNWLCNATEESAAHLWTMALENFPQWATQRGIQIQVTLKPLRFLRHYARRVLCLCGEFSCASASKIRLDWRNRCSNLRRGVRQCFFGLFK